MEVVIKRSRYIIDLKIHSYSGMLFFAHPLMPNSLCFNEMLGTSPLVVPKSAGFSEQTYEYVAFVPVFCLFSEQRQIDSVMCKLQFLLFFL